METGTMWGVIDTIPNVMVLDSLCSIVQSIVNRPEDDLGEDFGPAVFVNIVFNAPKTLKKTHIRNAFNLLFERFPWQRWRAVEQSQCFCFFFNLRLSLFLAKMAIATDSTSAFVTCFKHHNMKVEALESAGTWFSLAPNPWVTAHLQSAL